MLKLYSWHFIWGFPFNLLPRNFLSFFCCCYVDHFKVFIEFIITILFLLYVLFCFFPEACGNLAPQPGTEPTHIGRGSLNYWTTKEVPGLLFRLCSSQSSKKAMAPHSSTLAWKIPWTEEPRRLQSTGSWRVRHDWAISLSLFTFMHWRRKWQPTPVFLPGESQGQRNLVGCRRWGHTQSDTTQVTQ